MRAGIQIPSRSHLPGDNSTNDGSVDKARPFISLLPDLIQSSARDDALGVTGRCRLPSGAASSGPLQTLQCLQRIRALSICQAHQFELNVGHPSMTHRAKKAEAVLPVSLQPSSVPPGLRLPGAESPPSLDSCKKARALRCCCCLHGLTSCSTTGCTPNVALRDVCSIN